MAFISDGYGSGFFGTITVQDRNLDYSTLQFQLRATDEVEAATEMGNIRAAFDNVSYGVIVAQGITQRSVNDSIGIPAQGEVQIKARLSYQEKDSFHKGVLDIPAPKETIFLALTGKGNKIVDVANAAVVAYTDLFRDGADCFVGAGKSLEYLLEGRKVSSRSGLRSG